MTFVVAGGIGQLKPSSAFLGWSSVNLNAVNPPVPPGWTGPPSLGTSLTNSNRTVRSSTTGYVINTTSVKGVSSGQVYFEVTNTAVITDYNYIYIGVAMANSNVYSAGLDGNSAGFSPGTSANWTLYYGNNSIYNTAAAPTNTDRIGVAVDLTVAGGGCGLYFRLNGTWLANGANSPTFPAGSPDVTLGTGGLFLPVYIMASTYNTNAMTLNTGNAGWGNAPPAGYVGWG